MFNDSRKYRRVPDHCHYAGKFRGAVDSMCNLSIRHQKK